MENNDFTVTISVGHTPPQQAFDAITNVRDWWTGEIAGDSHKEGDEFTYRYQDFHYSKHQVTQLIPGKKVEWLINDASLNFVEDKTEWTGTRIVFDISEKYGETQVRFTHYGLLPQNQCYGACSNAWGGYISNNLRNLIITGERQS